VQDAHDAVVRAQLARFNGREVRTMGDGFLATFDGPGRAVRCAQAISESVKPLGIEIRAGLHAGEIELVDDDIAGIAVAIGARIGALATARRCWCRARSAISSPDRRSSSKTAAPTR
jgi:class 3 adenylate cyclase